jgi:hypothetical protein
LFVNQTVGAPTTPACSIACFSAGTAAKACAAARVANSCVTVTSFGLSADW